MHVHSRDCLFYCATDVEVGLARVLRVNAALHADLGRSPVPRLGGAAHYFVETEIVQLAAQVLAHLSLRESAELAFEVTHVRVVDVAVDDVGHDVAVDLRANRVGRLTDGAELTAARREETDDRGLVERLALDGPLESTGQLGRLAVARPHSMASVTRLDELQVVLRWRRHERARRPLVDTRESFGVDPTKHRRSHCLVQPSLPLQRVLGVDGEALDQKLAGRLGLPGQMVELGPGSFRVHEIWGEG